MKNNASAGWLLIFLVFATLFALGQFANILVHSPNIFVIALLIVSFGLVLFFGDWKDVNAKDMEE